MPMVETEAKRSPRIRSQNNGFKHSNCLNRNCLACAAIPPTIPSKMLKRIGDDFCKLNPALFSEDALKSKHQEHQAIGTKKPARKIISSKRQKDKGKMEAQDSPWASKKTKN